ncbi:MAG: HEAT repeat domain-containing protein [Sedimentisphaerales bacterium]|nr:HEAT repeat domain-containing protein [Sedimentisphaerales bacterium]
MNPFVKVLAAALFIVFCFVLMGSPCGLVGQTAAAADTAHLKALIVTGQTNPWHKWEISSPILKQLLEQTGLFKVDIATSPPGSDGLENFKPSFADYNVVVLDYDGYNRPGWSEQTKTAFVEYVTSGGGVVIYHSSDNAFPDWKQYNEIIGLGGWGGRDEKTGPMVYWRDGKVILDNSPGAAGAHGTAHPFQVVNRSSDHPITKDLPQKWMHAEDELYGKLRGPAKNLTVLATAYSKPVGKGTGEHELVLFTVNYGKGRVFHTTLGHVEKLPAPAVECVGFIVTFQRGAEWAATGGVTQKVPDDFPTATEVHTRKDSVSASLASAALQLQAADKLLERIATYEFGQSRENLTKLTDIIHQSYDSPQLLTQLQKRFLEFLRSDATLAGKQFICKHLSIIGTEEAVPALAAMLTQPATSDMSRYALERIPGAAVNEALRNVLDKTSGKTKIGIINSLGERRDKAAVTTLSKLLSDTDKEVAQAAAASLGKIAGPAAAAELGKALKQASGVWHADLGDAYLTCACNLAASGDKKAAADIYKELYTPAESTLIRSAALAGLVAARPEKAVELVIDALKGNEPTMQAAAISLVRQIPGTQTTQTIAAELPNLSAAGQVQLLSALADRGDPAALPVVVTAVKAQDDEIRIAALKALASLGDASTAALLAQTAAVTDGTERQTARDSLYRLNSPGVNETIVEHISKADPKVKVELIRSIGQRNIRESLQTLLKTVQDPNHNVRLESIKVLRDIAEPTHLPKLVDILINAKSDAELREAGKMVSSVASKSTFENAAAATILNVLGSAKDVNVRCVLFETLGSIGDVNSLGVLRTSLKDDSAEVQTAAVRALSDWPNAIPAADLLKVAQTSANQTHRALALRGYVRLIGLDGNRPAEKTVKMYGEVMQLTANVDEKKLVLSALANVKGLESLNMAALYLDDPALQQEAAAAVVKIAESTLKSNPDEAEAVLEKVLETTKSNSLRERAQELINRIK